MSLFLGKFLSRLLSPLPLALAAIALAALLLVRGSRRATLGLLGITFVGLWLASTPALVNRLVGALEGRHPGPPLASVEPADAILLLGGATEPALPPREFPELVEAGDRVVYSARLFRAGKAPFVVASGGSYETPALAELLGVLGVPEHAIVREERSANTWGNCVEAKTLLDARGAHDVLLVTSALHMRRAFATCRAAGLSVRPAPTDYWVAADEPKSALDWVPDAEALMLTQLVLRELLGYEVYRMRGWIRE